MTSSASPAVRERLRIAIQKSGRLADPARALLSGCGLTWSENKDRLYCFGESLPIDLLLVRDDDIPGLIANGVCDVGIVGRNVLREQSPAASLREWRPLGFGSCRLAIAVPESLDWQGPASLSGLRIATSYPGLLCQWLEANGVDARVVTLAGSVEIAPRLGTADAICDLVSTGATLQANQLRAVETVLLSEAVLAGRATPFEDARAELLELLLRRLDGVVRARQSKLVMFQARRESLPTLLDLLPDAEAPTVSTLDGSDRIALQALCKGTLGWQQLEALKNAGADALMVLPVERSLS